MKTQANALGKRLIIWAIIVVALLMIPLLAMQFTDEVNWDLTDFIIMGAVLFGLGTAYELVARRSETLSYRVGLGVGLVGAFLLFWVNGAVGIIGNEGQPANYLYVAVFVVGLIGAIISKFKAKGMSLTLFAAAAVQMLVPVIAYFIWPPPETSWSPGVFGVFLLTGFFAVIFLISGMLFKRASNN